jgi:tetratricopeptide (TPR) repeat protein
METLEADGSGHRYAFLVLLLEEDDAQVLARLLEDRVTESTRGSATFVAPSVKGVSYLEGNGVPPWANDVPKGAEVVLLIEHADELPGRLARLRGAARIYVGVPESLFDAYDSDAYDRIPDVRHFSIHGPLDFAVQVMIDFSRPGDSVHSILFDAADADRMRELTEDFTSQFEEQPSEEPAGAPGDAEFGSGFSAYTAGDYRTALSFFDDALAKGFADAANVHVWRGACLSELGSADDVEHRESRRLFAKALCAFNKARKLNYSDTPEPSRELDDWLAGTLYHLERYPSAAALYERLVKSLDTDVGSWLSLGSARALSGQYDEALRAYEKADSIDYRRSGLQRSRAIVLNVLGRQVEAKRAIDQAIEQAPDDASAYFTRAEIRRLLGMAAEALDDYRDAERHGYPSDGVLQVGRGVAYSELERHLESLIPYKKARDLARDNGTTETLSRAYEGIGYALARVGNELSEARNACQESISLGSASPTVFATLADVLNRLDLPYEAEAAIDQAIEVSASANWRTTWRLYWLRAGIRFALADRDNDREEAQAVLDDVAKAKSLWKTCDPLLAGERRDQARLFLLEGEAQLLLRHLGHARAAWRRASQIAQPGTVELIAADKYLRSLARAPRPLPHRFAPLVTGLAVVLLGLFTWLLWMHRLDSAGFAATIGVLLLLPLAAYLLPAASRLKIGVLEVELLQRLDRRGPLPQPPILRPPEFPAVITPRKKSIPPAPRL